MKGLKPNPIKPHWLWGKDYRETNCKFNHPTFDKQYVKILIFCEWERRTAREIYPNTKAPMQEMLRDMVREGLLERTTDGKRNYFLTTVKGYSVLKEAKVKCQ